MGDPGRSCSREWKTKIGSLLIGNERRQKPCLGHLCHQFYEEKKISQKKI